MEKSTCVVFVMVPSVEVGEEVARHLLEEHLAACVNVLPGLESHYWWEGKIQHEREVLLLVKTRMEGFNDRFVPAVRKVHPYEEPEIIAVPIVAGSEGYLSWILRETKAIE